MRTRTSRALAVGLVLVVPGLAAVPARAAEAVTLTVTRGGAPLADAFVALTGPGGGFAGSTDGQGSVSFGDVPDGEYRAVASAPGARVASTTVTVGAGPVSAAVTLEDSGNRFRGLGAYGAQTTGIAADGRSGVFYLTASAIPSFYRTTDYGGTWSPVTVSSDDPDDGIDGSQWGRALTTSGFPGEVAAVHPDKIWYSRDFGTTWDSLARPTDMVASPGPAPAPQLLWGHVGGTSVLVLADRAGTGTWYARMPTAPGDAVPTSFAPVQASFKHSADDLLAVASGENRPVLAVAAGAGTDVTLYELDDTPSAAEDPSAPLTGAAPAGAPMVLQLGGPATGPVLGSGRTPDTVLAFTRDGGGAARMSTYDDGSSAWIATSSTVFHSYDERIVAADGVNAACWVPGDTTVVGSVSPQGGTGTVSSCWATQAGLDGSELHLRPVSGINNNTGLAFDAGYNGTTNRVILSGDGSKGAAKSATQADGLNRPLFPQWPSLAGPGTDPTSGGVSVEGVDAGTVTDTAFGPGGPHQLAVTFSFSGGGRKLASLDGGQSWTTLHDEGGSAVDWWAGDAAGQAWILTGSMPNPQLLAATALPTTADAAGGDALTDALDSGRGELAGTGPDKWNVPDAGLGGRADRARVTAIAGLPGTDHAYVAVSTGNGFSFSAGGLRRVTLAAGTPPAAIVAAAGTALEDVTNPVVALAACPVAGSAASSAGKVYAALASSGESPGGIAVISDAAGESPAVARARASGQPLEGDFNDVRVDCASGTVVAGRGPTTAAPLVRSTDGGATFSPVVIDPPPPPAGEPRPDLSNVEALEVNPGGEIVAVGQDGSVVTSADHGDTWLVVNNAADPQDVNFGGPPGDLETPPAEAAGPALMTARPTAAAQLAPGRLLLGSGSGVLSAAVTDRTTPGVPSLAALPAVQTGRTFAVSWSPAADADSGVAGYVADRRARSFGTTTYTTHAGYRVQAGRSFPFTGSTGSEQCFRVRARNGVGLLSAYGAWRCTVVPADDSDLTRTAQWVARTGSGHYLGTYVETSTAGQHLTEPVSGAEAISLIATRCPGCGTVEVYIGSTLLKRVSLSAATTAKRQVIPVTTSGPRTGTVKIRVVTSGKPVRIDGLAVSR